MARLERRERQLQDFVVSARTETPVFVDSKLHVVAVGLSVGPSVVTRDFLGGAVIRARVTSSQSHAIIAVVQAFIKSVDGQMSNAAAALSLRPNESRSIELLCPAAIVPRAIIWSATTL